MTTRFEAGSPKTVEAGRRGGKASRRRLTLTMVGRELGPLETVTDAQRQLRQLMLWGASGLLPSGTILNGCVRSLEIWIKGEESRLAFEDVADLRAALTESQEEANHLRAKVAELEATVRQLGRAA